MADDRRDPTVPDRRAYPSRRVLGRRQTDREPPLPPAWISVRHYCQRYELSRATVYKYLEDGLLAKWQVGRVLRVRNLPPLEKR